MMRTLKLKMVLTDEQKGSLLRTMEAYTRAFDIAAEWGYRNKTHDKYLMHRYLYFPTREALPGLSSYLVQSARDTACEALKQCKCRTMPHRKPHSAVRFSWKAAKVFLESTIVKIHSIDGKITANYVRYDYMDTYVDWTVGSSVLVWDRPSKEFYLGLVVKKNDPEHLPGEVLGIDRGLKHVAVASNNMFFDSSRINATRGRYAKNKAELQAKGTRSATRRLRQQSGRERRFVTCENHWISKKIVNTNFSVFALEDLSTIRRNRWLNRKMKRSIGTWAFKQLEEFIQYKAQALGKEVVSVDPTCTSQMCSACGWIDKESRMKGHFHCVKCGFELDADLNASRNIARLGISETGRLRAHQPNATGVEGDLSGVRNKVLSPVASLKAPYTMSPSDLGANEQWVLDGAIS